jgi:hypothetical protein
MKLYIKISILTSLGFFFFLHLIEFLLQKNFIKSPQEKNNEIYLHETLYYGRVLEKDPYEGFTIKHLHPYYFLSLPWKQDLIEQINNEFISLDKNGFRKTNYIQKKNAVLLGGSVAFSHFASGNDKSIASELTKLINFNFINVNAPGWNSYQELIGLLNHKGEYSLSISLSLANDITIYCKNKNSYKNEFIINTPESFFRLDKLVNNYNAQVKEIVDVAPPPDFNDRNIFKKIIFSQYPSIYKYLSFKKKRFEFEESKIKNPSCIKDANIIAENFIENQKKMRDISNQKNSNHFTIIQPFYDLHSNKKSSLNDEKFIELFKIVSEIVMRNEFCKNFCVNLIAAFEQENKNDLLYNYKIENNNFASAIFVDNLHLTDLGNKKLAKIIIENINNNLNLKIK